MNTDVLGRPHWGVTPHSGLHLLSNGQKSQTASTFIAPSDCVQFNVPTDT